jgi:hypothetical protein
VEPAIWPGLPDIPPGFSCRRGPSSCFWAGGAISIAHFVADPTQPYVMFPGTKYEHLMLPVTAAK